MLSRIVVVGIAFSSVVSLAWPVTVNQQSIDNTLARQNSETATMAGIHGLAALTRLPLNYEVTANDPNATSCGGDSRIWMSSRCQASNPNCQDFAGRFSACFPFVGNVPFLITLYGGNGLPGSDFQTLLMHELGHHTFYDPSSPSSLGHSNPADGACLMSQIPPALVGGDSGNRWPCRGELPYFAPRGPSTSEAKFVRASTEAALGVASSANGTGLSLAQGSRFIGARWAARGTGAPSQISTLSGFQVGGGIVSREYLIGSQQSFSAPFFLPFVPPNMVQAFGSEWAVAPGPGGCAGGVCGVPVPPETVSVYRRSVSGGTFTPVVTLPSPSRGQVSITLTPSARLLVAVTVYTALGGQAVCDPLVASTTGCTGDVMLFWSDPNDGTVFQQVSRPGVRSAVPAVVTCSEARWWISTNDVEDCKLLTVSDDPSLTQFSTRALQVHSLSWNELGPGSTATLGFAPNNIRNGVTGDIGIAGVSDRLVPDNEVAVASVNGRPFVFYFSNATWFSLPTGATANNTAIRFASEDLGSLLCTATATKGCFHVFIP